MSASEAMSSRAWTLWLESVGSAGRDYRLGYDVPGDFAWSANTAGWRSHGHC